MFYVVAVAMPVLFVYVWQKRKSKLILFGGIIFLALMLSVRTGTGLDLENYRAIFIRYGSELGILDDINIGGRLDFGYAVLNYIIARLGLSYHVLLFVIAALNFYSLCRFTDHCEIKSKVFALTIYFLIFDIYINSMQVLRQTLSISMYFLAAAAMKENKKIKTAALLLTGISFHWGTIFSLPVFFIANKRFRVRSLILASLLIPVLYYYAILSPLPEFIGHLKYNIAYYVSLMRNERQSSMIMAFVYIVIAIVWILILDSVRESRREGIIALKRINLAGKSKEIDFADMSAILFLISKACLSSYYISILPRLQMYLFFFVPFSIAKVTGRLKGRTRILIMMITISLFIIMFYMKLQASLKFFGNAAFVF